MEVAMTAKVIPATLVAIAALALVTAAAGSAVAGETRDKMMRATYARRAGWRGQGEHHE
jgi:hypothetical protein